MKTREYILTINIFGISTVSEKKDGAIEVISTGTINQLLEYFKTYDIEEETNVIIYIKGLKPNKKIEKIALEVLKERKNIKDVQIVFI